MKENQTRILIFLTNYLPHIGGAELATKDILDRLGDSFEVDIITARYSLKMPRKERIGRTQVYRVGLGISSLDKLILALWGGCFGGRLHKQRKYDIIHSVQASYGGIAAYFFKKKFSEIPFVLNLQEGKELEKQWFAVQYWRPRIIKAANKITVISKYLRNYVRKLGVDMDKVRLIPNGVDLSKFAKEYSYGELEELKKKLGIRPYEKVILTSSRLEKKNSVENLIEAMKYVNSEAKLIIVGDGSLRGYLETVAKDNVLFLGTIEHKELPRYMAIANLFVRPSISEGLGTAFLEAMAAGLPIVGTNVGGIPDFLKDFRTGLFCTIEPKSIAEKINLLLKDKDLRNSISRNAQKLASEKYQWDNIVEEYKKLYLEL